LVAAFTQTNKQGRQRQAIETQRENTKTRIDATTTANEKVQQRKKWLQSIIHVEHRSNINQFLFCRRLDSPQKEVSSTYRHQHTHNTTTTILIDLQRQICHPRCD